MWFWMPQDSENMELEGKRFIRGAQQPTQSRLTIPFGLVFKTANLQTYKQLPARLNDTRLLIQDCNEPPQPGGP